MALSTDSKTLLEINHLEFNESVKVGIIATDWNDAIVAEQIKGAQKIASELNIPAPLIKYVPGSFEIPYACKQWYDSDNELDAIITFGAVIRGGTPHFEYVCKAVTEGLSQLNIMLPIPVIFGVLTLNNEQEAWERLGGFHGHKGEESMITALKMIFFKRNL